MKQVRLSTIKGEDNKFKLVKRKSAVDWRIVTKNKKFIVKKGDVMVESDGGKTKVITRRTWVHIIENV